MRSTKTPWLWLALALLSMSAPVLAQNDAARDAYERAREALDSEDFRAAVERFREMRTDYPSSEQFPNALYWEAFARYRMGSSRNLRESAALLDELTARYRDHSTYGEAQRLYTRVLGQLAERGETDAAREVHERAEGDVDAETRMMALNAILQMDSDRALPLLRKVLARRGREDAELRAKAMFLLAQHFDDEAKELMMETLRNDPDPEVRGQAMFWLGQAAGDDVIPLVEEILADPNLGDMYEQAVFALSQNNSERSSELLRDLAIDPKIDDDIRGNAIFWLGQRRGSFEFLSGLYESLDDSELREQVIFAMSQQGGPRQMEWLKALFYDEDEDIEVRKNALFWLAQNSEFGFEELEGLYGTVTHVEMKEQIIFALSQHGGKRGVDALIKIARTEQDPEMRKNAIFWIGQSGDDSALDFLEELIDQ